MMGKREVECFGDAAEKSDTVVLMVTMEVIP